MRKFRSHLLTSLALLLFWAIMPGDSEALAQGRGARLAAAQPAALSSAASPGSLADERNYDVQIYLMVASNDAASQRVDLPQPLEGVVRGLRTTLPFNNYRLAATFLNRVTNGSNLQFNGVAGSLFTASPVPSSPTFYEFVLEGINAGPSAAGQPLVQINRFKFTMRLPLVTSSIQSPNGTTVPVINYEPTGINTRVSISEATPTLVGTMTTGRTDESYIVVVNIRPVP